MSLFSTCCTTFADLSRAAAKAAKATLRQRGWLPSASNWAARAEICERCPMRIVKCGVSYCGKPFLQQIERDQVLDGCGCPTHKKAKDPSEHCPIIRLGVAASRSEIGCNCKWCTSLSN